MSILTECGTIMMTVKCNDHLLPVGMFSISFMLLVWFIVFSHLSTKRTHHGNVCFIKIGVSPTETSDFIQDSISSNFSLERRYV